MATPPAMTRAHLLPLAAALLAACGATPTPAPDASAVADSALAAPDTAVAPDVVAQDVTPVDAPSRADDTPVALDGVTAADVVTAPDVVAPDVVDASTADVPTDASIPVDAPRRSFGEIYETILRPRCAECHGADRVGSAFVMPDAMGAYRALVNVRVQSPWLDTCDYTARFTGRVSYRVRPGDPAASMLYFLPECYVRDAQHMRLTPEEREVIRGWILRGAPETEL